MSALIPAEAADESSEALTPDKTHESNFELEEQANQDNTYEEQNEEIESEDIARESPRQLEQESPRLLHQQEQDFVEEQSSLVAESEASSLQEFEQMEKEGQVF